jgi:hypothetical protein
MNFSAHCAIDPWNRTQLACQEDGVFSKLFQIQSFIMTADDSPYECVKRDVIQVDLFFFFDVKAVAVADVICVFIVFLS